MGLTRIAIQRPLAMIMFISWLLLMGGIAYERLPRDRFPQLSFPFVSISVSYPGAGPGDVEELVTKVLEDAVSEVQGLDGISSTSSEGRSQVIVRFVQGTDTDLAASDIERSLAAAQDRLPSDASAPTVLKAETSDLPVMNVSLSGNRSLAELYDLGSSIVQPRLQSVVGVADTQLVGGLRREIQVKVDLKRLRAYGLSIDQVSRALSDENVGSPAGQLVDGDSVESVRTVSLYRSLDELRQAPITSGARVVKLQDVATVADTYAEQLRLHRLNGREAIGFIVTKQADANAVQVSNDIRDAIERMKELLPADVTLTVTNDSAIYTRNALDATMFDLELGVVLTALVLLVFLHTLRPTGIVLLSVPTSLISTFMVMYFSGFTLNMFSLMALALSIGILVDDSIVVLENIERHLELGESPWQAAIKGRNEIGMAAITLTLVDVVVFLPVTFLSGNIGRTSREFGITMAAATLFSLFISFTLTPMLASRFLKPPNPVSRNPLALFGHLWDAGYHRLADVYRVVLRLALSTMGRRVVIGLVVISLLISLGMLRRGAVGTEFTPQEDDGLFVIFLTTEPGTSLLGTDQVVRTFEARLAKVPEVKTVFTSVGVGGALGQAASPRNASIYIELVGRGERQRSLFQVLDEVRTWRTEFPSVKMRTSVANLLAGGGAPPLNIQIIGDDFEVLRQIAAEYEAVVRSTAGVADINNDAAERDPELRALVDRQRLSDARVSASTVASAMRTVVGGNVATQLRPEHDDQVDVRVLAADVDREHAGDIGAIPVSSDLGGIFRLDQVSRVVRDSGPAQIQRIDRQRAISITANVSGRPLGDVARDIRLKAASISLPDRYRVVYAAQVQQQENTFSTLLSTMALSMVLVYMLLIALYESLLAPLAIMFSIPVAVVGAVLGLYVSHNTLNLFSLIGSIVLMGLVGKNAILLIDYAIMLRATGLSREEALLRAGYTRLRPILMTTATVVFAMLPPAMKLEAGGELRAPMAVVIIGGMISSTLLSLVLVPVIYTLLEDGKQMVLARRSRRSGRQLRAGESSRVADIRPIQGGASDS